MRTKLAALCDRVIEAGWLLALVIEPLYFNIYSNRVFEPDKLGLLRSIVAIMAVAWLTRLGEQMLGQKARTSVPREGSSKAWWRFPLLIPTLLLVVVYILATITSVVPRVSLWGSYQRLQGLYSTLSYIVIFALMVQNLRRREQLQRVLTTAILTSFPIALYGLMQHNTLDPLPWGGDVTYRVAANMGNAIFVGAYLILVVPLTLARVVQLHAQAMQGLARRTQTVLVVGFWLLWVAQFYAWAVIGFAPALISGLALMAIMTLLAAYLQRPLAKFLLMGAYGIILSAQLVCIFFSQSRGPMLGLVVAVFFLGLLYIFTRRWRAVAVSFVSLAVAFVVLMVVINLPQSPLEQVRKWPYVGRLGQVFEVESGTGKVRLLIWEGVVAMLRANPARTLIGYGPEAMYVAYNPFYPPDLAHYEARNASPDRSHNETFDALVSTGVTGLVAYLLLFGSVFYYGFRWLGLVRTRRQRNAFLAMGAAGALVGALAPYALEGTWRFSGVGLPFGFMAGLVLYVTTVALASMLRQGASASGEDAPLDVWDTLLMVALVASVAGHFIEINLGIAIAATRTYFWTLAALVVLLGKRLVPVEGIGAVTAEARGGAAAVSGEAQAHLEARRRSRKRRTGGAEAAPAHPLSVGPVVESALAQVAALGVVGTLILSTMSFDYTTNSLGLTNPFAVIITALTTMSAKKAGDSFSPAMAWLVLVVFVVLILVIVAEVAQRESKERDVSWWLTSLGVAAGLSGGLGLLYALIHAARLRPGGDISRVAYEYYALMLALWALLAVLLFRAQPRPAKWGIGPSALIYLVLIVITVFFVDNANISMIRADILYKQGLRYDQEGSWDNAILLYTRALELAPSEDFYHLFRGRALMERGKQEKDVRTREAIFGRALEALNEARRLNPLNTDHTANQARLHRTWGEMSTDATQRSDHFKRSLEFYAQATQLSPNNAQLYNEWGLVYSLMGENDLALAKYEQSLALDSEYLQTYFLLGDVYLSRKQWPEAIQVYSKSVAMDAALVQGWSSLGYAYSQMGDFTQAISANLQVLAKSPTDYNTLKNLTILYNEAARPADALTYAEKALAVAPDQDKTTLQSYVQQLRGQLGKE